MRGTVEEVLREPKLRQEDRDVLAHYPATYFVDYVPRSAAALGDKPRIPSASLSPDYLAGRKILRKHEHLKFRYEIKHHVGQGTFSNVYLVVDHRSWRVKGDPEKCFVVAKVTRASPAYVQASRREQSVLQDLAAHGVPGIMPPTDTFMAGESACTVFPKMDYNLYQYTQRAKRAGTPISTAMVIWFLRETTATFAGAHAAGWVHADVKPENYMLNVSQDRRDPRSKSFTAVAVIDWGSARGNDFKAAPPGYIQSRYYRAPEVVARQETDASIDVWSMGCVAYELATGKVLFPAENEPQLQEMHAAWPASRKNAMCHPGVADPLVREYILRATAMDPRVRSTAADLLALLTPPQPPHRPDQPAREQEHKRHHHDERPPGGGRSRSVPPRV